ncbi:Endopolyphosphatase [Coemansia spiralis]|nr:Endopolyphosphatase [Coemansia spiralis]
MLVAVELLAASDTAPAGDDGRRLEQPFVGQYLHITDLHVDMQYREGSTVYSSCHRRPPPSVAGAVDGDGHKHTGRFGLALSKCDSPVALINATRDFLQSEMANVDFVAWTGDSGRHDRDLDQPRTFGEIVDGNRIAAAALRAAYPHIPVVPNMGNNDVSPHNELPAPGHQRARRTFAKLAEAWAGMVPDDQMATFLYGGYFARDVAEYTGRAGGARGLTVLSLNTMYWFRANDMVGGCRARDSPGLAQLAWVRYQLRRAHERNRDLILLGHVMPSRDNYRATCYHGYARTVTQTAPPPPRRATPNWPLPLVHAQLFGHSNVDVWGFIGHESAWLAGPDPLANGTAATEAASKDKRLWWEREVDDEDGRMGELIHTVWSGAADLVSVPGERPWEAMEDDPPVRFAAASDGTLWPTVATLMDPVKRVPSDFLDDLLGEFKRVVAQEPHNPRLGVATISPSIIPTYFPAFRIFHYLRGPATRGPWRLLPTGTLLDYDVYWADLPKLNRVSGTVAAFFTRLYRCSAVYGLPDLSVDSYLEWARRLVASKQLRKRFRSLTFLNSV